MRLTVKAIRDKKAKGEKTTALTAYDFSFAAILDACAIDIILVGDSLGMVLLGYDSTVPVSMREMLHHTKAVSRAVKHALLVADMPFGSYDHEDRALRNAVRFLKEAGADAVKLEGGFRVERQMEALVRNGIPVMGHLGMTPQTATTLGGYRVQGKEKERADEIFKEALLLDKLGVFSIVLECMPMNLAGDITKAVRCPTIGIGAGSKTDGQILVLHDMLGLQSKVHPKFVKAYAALEQETQRAVIQYRDEVLSGKFPAGKESY